MTSLVRHGRKAQPPDKNRLRYMESYQAFHQQVTGAWTSAYAGRVSQLLTSVSNTQGYQATNPTTGLGSWSIGGQGSQFTATFTMSTLAAYNPPMYAYRLNDQTYMTNQNTVTITTNQLAWQGWNQTYTTGTHTSIANQAVFQNWNQGFIQVATPDQVVREAARHGLTYARPVLTPEELAAQRQQAALALFQRVEAERLASQSASERALGTLLGLLTAEQRDEYSRKDYFHVVGSKGNLYRIIKGSSGNIRRVISRDDAGRGEAAFCVHSVHRLDATLATEMGLVGGYLPHEDHMIQQMLHLQMDEETILAKANVHWGTREPTDDELRRFMDAAEASERDRTRELAPLFAQ